MSEDAKQLLIVCVSLVLAVSSVVWDIAWYNTSTTRTAIEAGLVEGVLPGEHGTHWVKPEFPPCSAP